MGALIHRRCVIMSETTRCVDKHTRRVPTKQTDKFLPPSDVLVVLFVVFALLLLLYGLLLFAGAFVVVFALL